MASPSPCPQAISAENAQRLYDALKDFHDGCKLEEVRTEKDVMRIEWRKDGVPAPLIEVRPRVCGEGSTLTGPEFSLSAPPGAVEQCPAAVEKLKSLIASESFGGAVRLGTAKGATPWEAIAGGGVLLLLLLVAGLIVWRRRKR